MATASGNVDGPFVGSRLRLVQQWVMARIHNDVRAAGFDDVNRAHVLLFQRPSMHGRRPTAIADEMQITKQSVNELLGHLEGRGYLTREVDPGDHRARIVQLTKKGRAVERATLDAARNAELSIADMLGERRFKQLRSSLDELVRLTDERPR